MKPINLPDKLALFSSHWNPKAIAACNDNEAMVEEGKGAFPFHMHDTSDNLFLVLEGSTVMEYEEAAPVTAGPGELVIVPRAEEEGMALLIEPKGEPNSGDSGTTPAPQNRI
ncbi:cupin domain-containing protein [Vannielia sp.]|uniref:cupin domain-containing protein n=1 Tax=Vannielia sp. TaxID=2813045 RepID=UPI002602720E|nr:cupin domain-containing protein [Vannielia sp.]MDF1871772.1 cupin domain-containing protein [Vannielia sp.]